MSAAIQAAAPGWQNAAAAAYWADNTALQGDFPSLEDMQKMRACAADLFFAELGGQQEK